MRAEVPGEAHERPAELASINSRPSSGKPRTTSSRASSTPRGTRTSSLLARTTLTPVSTERMNSGTTISDNRSQGHRFAQPLGHRRLSVDRFFSPDDVASESGRSGVMGQEDRIHPMPRIPQKTSLFPTRTDRVSAEYLPDLQASRSQSVSMRISASSRKGGTRTPLVEELTFELEGDTPLWPGASSRQPAGRPPALSRAFASLKGSLRRSSSAAIARVRPTMPGTDPRRLTGVAMRPC